MDMAHLSRKTDADARKCLPLGQGNRSEGIRRCSENNGVIYQAAVSQGLATGTGLIVAGVGRAKKAAEHGHIPEARGVRLVENLNQRVVLSPKAMKCASLRSELRNERARK
jgi:hypothetical protein